MNSIGRRALLRAMLVTAAYFVWWSRPERVFALDGASAGTRPPAVPVAGLPLPDFLELSRIVTGQPELSESVGHRLLALYESTPDRLKRLSDLYRRVAAADAGEAPLIDFDMWIRSAGEAEEALGQTARQLLDQWYTGIYEDDRQRLVFSYEEALMYRPCADMHPVPTRCGGEMGFWSRPPEGGVEAPVDLPISLPDRRG